MNQSSGSGEMQLYREQLKEIRELTSHGVCRDYLARTADDKATFPCGHHETIPNSQKKLVSKHAVFVREEERKNDDGKVALFSTYYYPAVKWSLTGAVMKVTGGDSIMPVAPFGDIMRLFEPHVKSWDFPFGTKSFHYVSHFDNYSETRFTFDENGKRIKHTDQCQVADIHRLIDLALAYLDRVEKMARKIKLNSEYPLVGNENFKFFDPAMVEAVTDAGKRALVGVVGFQDTDSLMNTIEVTMTRATIAPITDVADLGENLSVYTVLGNRVVGMKEDGKHRFLQGEHVIYIPEGMIIPEEHLKARGYWDEEKNRGLLDGGKRNRVKKRNFLGIPSIGLIWKTEPDYDYQDGPNMPPVQVGLLVSNGADTMFVTEGQDVTDFFGLVMHGA
jgi:hypothetical protein